jgi:hypothetical protein
MKIGLMSLLGLLFVALKLTGAIKWSWVWVLAPFWIPIAITALMLAIVLIHPKLRKNFILIIKERYL